MFSVFVTSLSKSVSVLFLAMPLAIYTEYIKKANMRRVTYASQYSKWPMIMPFLIALNFHFSEAECYV